MCIYDCYADWDCGGLYWYCWYNCWYDCCEGEYDYGSFTREPDRDMGYANEW